MIKIEGTIALAANLAKCTRLTEISLSSCLIDGHIVERISKVDGTDLWDEGGLPILGDPRGSRCQFGAEEAVLRILSGLVLRVAPVPSRSPLASVAATLT